MSLYVPRRSPPNFLSGTRKVLTASLRQLLRRLRPRRARHDGAFHDALFASVPNAVAVVDHEGRFLDVNPGFEALFGFKQAELVGRLLVDLIVPASGREAALRLQDRVRAGEAVVTETERRCKDGRVVTVRVSVARPDVENGGQVLFLYTDITELRNAERALRAAQARLHQVVASSTAVIYATEFAGGNFRPTWVSDNLGTIVGCPAAEALEPDWWIDRLHPDDRARVLAEMSRLLSEDRLTTEYRFRHGDGGYRWIRDESRLQRDASGAPAEVFGAWLDITDRRVAEDQMRTARDMAERAARVQATFLANMSHEIRTPMNAILGFTELLLASEITAEQQRSLGLIRSAGEALVMLLNDILDFSKIEAERVVIEAIPFDPRYVLESTLSLLAVRLAERPIELIADIAPDLPHQVRGDPGRLRQVLTNLVGNAIKFTSQGEVVVTAKCLGSEDGRLRVRFGVRDTGIGIASDKLGLIFNEFSQADASMTRKYGGTGLGLAIARRLVALMGGELTVESEEGRGTEFAFTLPFPVEAAGPVPVAGVDKLAGQRILVVDDNATNRRIVRELLSLAGVSVYEAPGAGPGLHAIQEAHREGRPFALAIIDAQMPDRDGFELAVAIRNDPAIAGTRLLMLTSAGRSGDTQRCREVGIQGYLTKPASRNDLLDAAAALVGGGRALAEAGLVTRHSMAETRPHLRILLVEDNAVNQEIAATMLRKRGHTVQTANNGREAVEEVRRRTYDLVLMDIQMPEMDGYAATRAIRAGPVGASVPILALTAHALSGERQRCLDEGMNGYITKPFAPYDLFAAVEQFGQPSTATPPPEEPAQAPAASSSPVDLETFRASMRDAGAEDAVDEILATYIGSAPGSLAALASAVEAGDAAAIAKAAHFFKSASGAIGAGALAAGLQEIELAGKEGAIERARIGFELVQREVKAVLDCLRTARPGA